MVPLATTAPGSRRARAQSTSLVPAIERTRINTVIFLLAFTCVTERIGLTAGKFPLSFSLFLVPSVIGALIVFDFFRIDRRTILIYGAYLSCVMLSTVINGTSAYLKPTAIALNLGLALLFCVSAPLGKEGQLLFYKRLCALLVLFALLSSVQFFGQFIIKGTRLFSLEGIIPESLRQDQHFAFLNPTAYGSGIYRSNGFFFLEPSVAGMFYARGLAIIIAVRPTFLGIAVSSMGLLVTYSGNGFLSFLVFLAGYTVAILSKPRLHVLLATAIVSVAAIGGAIAFNDLIGLDRVVDRLNEFGSTGSSAFARYVGPSELLWKNLGKTDLVHLLFGVGIGSSDVFRTEGPVAFVPPAIVVVTYESGFIGLCLYVWLFASAFARTFKSVPLRLAILTQYVLIDPGSSNVVQVILSSYLVAAAISRSPEDRLRPRNILSSP